MGSRRASASRGIATPAEFCSLLAGPSRLMWPAAAPRAVDASVVRAWSRGRIRRWGKRLWPT